MGAPHDRLGPGVRRHRPAGSATLAVLDTGVDAVGDLSVVGGYSALGGGTGDPNGHGTWMASIAAATVNNGTGIAGVGYDGVSVMPLEVLSADGTGQDSDIIAGVVWAADHGADVIRWRSPTPATPQALQDAIDYAWSQGALSVAAVGNDGSTTPTYPAGDSKVVGVAAHQPGRHALVRLELRRGRVHLRARRRICANDASGTTSVTGTSASAAIVAGAVAFLKANDPAASNGTVVGRLAGTRTPGAPATAASTWLVPFQMSRPTNSSPSAPPAAARLSVHNSDRGSPAVEQCHPLDGRQRGP